MNQLTYMNDSTWWMVALMLLVVVLLGWAILRQAEKDMEEMEARMMLHPLDPSNKALTEQQLREWAEYDEQIDAAPDGPLVAPGRCPETDQPCSNPKCSEGCVAFRMLH